MAFVLLMDLDFFWHGSELDRFKRTYVGHLLVARCTGRSMSSWLLSARVPLPAQRTPGSLEPRP